MQLHYGDMTDSTCLVKIIAEVKPTEIYNLAAQSHVKVSEIPCLKCPSRFQDTARPLLNGHRPLQSKTGCIIKLTVRAKGRLRQA